MRALCHGYGDRPALLIQVVAPLAIWHDERNSPAMLQSVDSLHRRDRDMFWRLAQALLEHPDQRIVDIAGKLVDQAEYAEEHEPAQEIISGIAAILDEVAGIPAAEVVPEAHFVRDLDLDSLSMVESVMAAEEQFGIMISDSDIGSLQTVGQFAEYIGERLRDRTTGHQAQ